eukprot:4982750-Amphidinium_carterae.1
MLTGHVEKALIQNHICDIRLEDTQQTYLTRHLSLLSILSHVVIVVGHGVAFLLPMPRSFLLTTLQMLNAQCQRTSRTTVAPFPWDQPRCDMAADMVLVLGSLSYSSCVVQNQIGDVDEKPVMGSLYRSSMKHVVVTCVRCLPIHSVSCVD